MSDFPNLRGNFSFIVRSASLRDLHTLLSVLHDELSSVFADVGEPLGLAADRLAEYLVSKRGVKPPA